MGSMASEHIPTPWRETPLIESAALSKAAGCRIFCKLENLQPSGAFKSRGIGNFIRYCVINCPAPAPLHFYSPSGGNAGLACASAAQLLGYPSTVVVPMSTKPMMIAKIRAAGATDVIQNGASWMEANKFLLEKLMPKDPNGVYVPAFDNQLIWDGNATMASEIKAELGDGSLDAVVCSVGGGGLMCGLVQGIEAEYGKKVRILAMETEGAHSLHNSLEKGENTTLEAITSIATTLGARRVADRTFEYGRCNNVQSEVISDAEAAMGCWRFADDERMLVEVACGASIAPCYNGKLRKFLPELTKDSKVVIVVCGGSGVSLDMLEQYKKDFAGAALLGTSNVEVFSTLSIPLKSV